ncbi:MAG: rhodanese-like domain-containing protein [Burkholderiales bacterium]
MSVLNIAAYKFVTLDDLLERRVELLARCEALALKGTILLATEGINLFLAGSESGINGFKAMLHNDPAFADIAYKDSWSEQQPFGKMLVKLKQEIIPLGISEVNPATNPAPRLTPQQLKAWLDAGRDVLLLDTRNGFEVDHGTFANAKHLSINNFRHLPQALQQIDENAKQKPVVTFCTGGIRCEKAAPYLLQQGFQEVYQLDGGILKYFEECGNAHFNGECFVFDERVALDAELNPARDVG